MAVGNSLANRQQKTGLTAYLTNDAVKNQINENCESRLLHIWISRSLSSCPKRNRNPKKNNRCLVFSVWPKRFSFSYLISSISTSTRGSSA